MALRKYNWDEWFALGHFTLKRGVNYKVSQSTMCQTIRNNASQRKFRVNIEDDGDSITVTVTGVTTDDLHTDRIAFIEQ